MLQHIKNIELKHETLPAEELPDRIIFRGKVERGLRDSAMNNVYSKEEAKEKLSKWLK